MTTTIMTNTASKNVFSELTSRELSRWVQSFTSGHYYYYYD